MGGSLFVVSLDFELRWGVRDSKSMDTYGRRILGVRQAIPSILSLFERRGIHATWAAVGFVLCEGRDDLLAVAPKERPRYTRGALSPYTDIPMLGADERSDPFHFAPSLARAIANTPHQELATHTLSHYYCLEDGATVDAFRADLQSAAALVARYGTPVRSIVFPRNQYNDDHLHACRELGIIAYRGNPEFSFYEPRSGERDSVLRRAQRIADAYVPVVRHKSFVQRHADDQPVDVPATRFFRPWIPKLRALEPLRVGRILREMTDAAVNNQLYHLWWHPHNFGIHLENNLRALDRILQYAGRLADSHGMRSMTMHEAATTFAAA
jgi:peptidoglycan/xylan/chitin deacetylase (PgdA/CDA1 family)